MSSALYFRLLVCLCTALQISQAVAAPVTGLPIAFIDRDSYLTDESTGLDWLDISFTLGKTYSESVGQVANDSTVAGGGWRIATQQELEALIGTFFGVNLVPSGTFSTTFLDLNLTTLFATALDGYVMQNFSYVQGFLSGGEFPSWITFNSIRNPGGQNFGQIDTPQQWWDGISNADIGAFLVRTTNTVPEPMSGALVALALSLMGIGHRLKSFVQ